MSRRRVRHSSATPAGARWAAGPRRTASRPISTPTGCSPPRPLGLAVARRAVARRRAARPVRRGRRPRHARRAGLARRAARPATRSTCTCCACGAASPRSGSRSGPCGPGATCSKRPPTGTATRTEARTGNNPRVQLGIDTGGTFTDAVDGDGRVAKVLSTRDDPARAVAEAIARARRRGRPGRARPRHHGRDQRAPRAPRRARRADRDARVRRRHRDRAPAPPVVVRPVRRPARAARAARAPVRGRRAGSTRAATRSNAWDGVVPALPSDVDAVAVCLLHADRNPRPERALAAAVRAAGFDVTASSELSPEFREYERMVTTVVNAYLRPACAPYLARLAELADEVLVMTSAGGLVAVGARGRRRRPRCCSRVRRAACGPPPRSAAACGYPDAVAFDMGGTSTDVCLVRGGVPEPAPQRSRRRLPDPAARARHPHDRRGRRFDRAHRRRRRPRRRAATARAPRPGPACYGLGGTAPTVTDADLVLGRIDDQVDVPRSRPARRRARRATRCERAGVHAAGVVAVVDAAMEQAVRAVTVERGVDPRQLALVAFGGAGPLHACAIADALGMAAVIIPPRAGVGSAVGLLCSPRRQEVVQSVGAAAPTALDAAPRRGRGARPRRSSAPTPTIETAVDCRYVGQSHEITVADADDFPAEHERRNGHARPGAPVEVVAVRAARDRRRAAGGDRPPGRRASAGARSRGRRRSRLHRVDPRGLGRRTPRALGCMGARRDA